MFFDEAPKTRLEDFFNFREEFEAFGKALEKKSRLIVVSGLRRTGKTSLVLTALNEKKTPFTLIDGRAFAAAPVISRMEFIQAVQDSLNRCLKLQKSWWKRIEKAVKGVRGVEVEAGTPPSIRLTWGERPAEAADLPTLLENLGGICIEDGKHLVVVFDEAQEFRRLAGLDLAKLLAYIYDHVRTVQLVVTGSQVGFLHGFLGVEDADSPLFGRHYVEIETQHLNPVQARAFLKEGFSQLGWQPDQRQLTDAVARLDGVIGWLAHVGAAAAHAGKLTEEILQKAMNSAAALATNELNNFLAYRIQARTRYLTILRHLASSGSAHWSELKRAVETQEGRQLSPAVFAQLLDNLVKSGFARKHNGAYEIPDPPLIPALRENLIK